jgi:hypothetical protein
MTTETPSLADEIRGKLTAATYPLKLADVAKGKKPQAEAAAALRIGIEQGWAFAAKSGPKGAERYWSRDEVQAVREAVLAAAGEPKSLAALKKVAKDTFKSDKAFADAVVDGLVSDGRLHPQSKAKTAAYGTTRPTDPNDVEAVTAALVAAAATPQPLAVLVKAVVGATKATNGFVESTAKGLVGEKLYEHPPAKGKTPHYGREKPREVPWHERRENAKAFSKFVADAKKLLDRAKVSADDFLAPLRLSLSPPKPGKDDFELSPGAATVVREPALPLVAPTTLDDLILRAVEASPVVSLADLRQNQRPEHQGKIFDEAVLRLADEERIVLYQDANPEQFSEAEKALLVRDGDSLFTTISKRS